MMVSNKPKRVVSQAPSKDGTCYAGCGARIQYRTNPRVYCDPCRSAKVRAAARISMTRQRRKRGIAKVKGTQICCQRCGGRFIRKGIAAKFCECCRPDQALEVARRISRAKASTEDGRKYQNAWLRNKLSTDPAWRVSAHMRTLMHRALGSGKAGRSWREFVSYTLPELMEHLERQFLPGMSWENRGDWHIDHIVPRASFDYSSPADPEFRACWALSNLRPLWALDNIRKNDRRTHLI